MIKLLCIISLFAASFKPIDYIGQYAKLAQIEQQMYGVPASLTLAQAILETGWGKSKGAKLFNNHFGIHCHRRKHYGECVSYIDNGHKVRLLRYNNITASFRSHSEYLTTGKYADLRTICGKSYSWCIELQNRGYSQDPLYAEKLQKIINDYNLEQYDNYE